MKYYVAYSGSNHVGCYKETRYKLEDSPFISDEMQERPLKFMQGSQLPRPPHAVRRKILRLRRT